MSASQAANVAAVRRYFDGCNSGDVEVLLSTLTSDVVHYFLAPSFEPIRGAGHLARHWCTFKLTLNPVWNVDHIIAQGDEVVSEWSCIWTPRRTQKRLMLRGSEWYVMRDARIAEIRAYFLHDDAADTGLVGFPYAARDYLNFEEEGPPIAAAARG